MGQGNIPFNGSR